MKRDFKLRSCTHHRQPYWLRLHEQSPPALDYVKSSVLEPAEAGFVCIALGLQPVGERVQDLSQTVADF